MNVDPALPVVPVVSWPRSVRRDHRYRVTVDLRLPAGADWVFDEEELTFGCIVDGAGMFAVESAGETRVVLHRFGGTYGSADYVVSLRPDAPPVRRASLLLSFSTAGGVLTGAAELPVDIADGEEPSAPVAAEPRIRPSAADDPAAPPVEWPRYLAGTGSDVWSMTVVDVGGVPSIVLGTDYGTVRIWSLVDGETRDIRLASSGPARLAPLSGSGPDALLAVGIGRDMFVLNISRGFPASSPGPVVTDTISALTTITSPGGSAVVALGTSNGEIAIIDPFSGYTVRQVLTGHRGPVHVLTTIIVAYRTVLVSGGADATVRVWDLDTGTALHTLIGHTAQINDVNGLDNAGSSRVATASDDGTVRIWDVVTGEAINSFGTTGSDWVNAVAQVRRSEG